MQESNPTTITSDRTELVRSPADKETTVSTLTIFNNSSSASRTYILEVYRASTGMFTPFEEETLDTKGRRIYPRSILLGPNDAIVAQEPDDSSEVIGFANYYVLDESGTMTHFNPRGKWDLNGTYSFLDVVEFEGKAYVVADRDSQTSGVEPREGEAGYGVGVPWERLISGISWQGEWDSGATYFRMDMVIYGNRTYLCLTDGLQGIQPNNDNRWRGIASTLTWRGEWDGATTYYKYDIATVGNERYVALEDGLVNVNPRDDDRWEVVLSRITWQGTYTSVKSYRQNDVVTFGDSAYIAIADIATGEQPDASGNWEVMFSVQSGDYTNLENRVTTLESEMGTAQSNISTLQSNMSTAQTNISGLQGDVTTLQDQVSNMGLSSELETKLNSIQADMQALLADSGLVDDEFDVVWYEGIGSISAQSPQGILVDTRNQSGDITLTNAKHGAIVAVCDVYGNADAYPIRVSDPNYQIAGKNELVITKNYAALELIFVSGQWFLFAK